MNKKAQELFRWENNPFTFRILPRYFVGYEADVNRMTDGLNNGSKFSVLLGPTGSGKTTFLKNLVEKLDEHTVIYLPKPPKNPEDWVTVFDRFIKPRFTLFSRKRDVNLYNLCEVLNRKFGGRKCLLFVDECHEASIDSLEWLRTITDQTDSLSVVLAGLPVFENMLKSSLETFMKRFNITLKLSNLTKAETRELIKRRVEGVGGDDIKPFTPQMLDYIYTRTGGFPREVLKICDELVQSALEKGISTVDTDLIKDTEAEAEEKLSLDATEELPHRQRLILETLGENGAMTPSEVVASMDLEEYKNKDNAVRSVNNLLRRLMQEGLVERKKVGKTYKYKVSGRFQSMMVKA